MLFFTLSIVHSQVSKVASSTGEGKKMGRQQVGYLDVLTATVRCLIILHFNGDPRIAGLRGLSMRAFVYPNFHADGCPMFLTPKQDKLVSSLQNIMINHISSYICFQKFGHRSFLAKVQEIFGTAKPQHI